MSYVLLATVTVLNDSTIMANIVTVISAYIYIRHLLVTGLSIASLVRIGNLTHTIELHRRYYARFVTIFFCTIKLAGNFKCNFTHEFGKLRAASFVYEVATAFSKDNVEKILARVTFAVANRKSIIITNHNSV